MIEIFRRRPVRPVFQPPAPQFPCAVKHDPWFLLCSRAEKDPNFMNVVDGIIKGDQLAQREMMFLNADNASFFRDTRETSHITADEASVTGATTDKMLHGANRTATPAFYFARAGKKTKVSLVMRVTSGAAIGNWGVELYYGTTDAGTTLLASSGAVAGGNSKTNITCSAWAHFTARGGADMTAIPMMATGAFFTDPASALMTNNYLLVPASAPAAVNINSTVTTGGCLIQAKNSGANANTYQVHELVFEALN